MGAVRRACGPARGDHPGAGAPLRGRRLPAAGRDAGGDGPPRAPARPGARVRRRRAAADRRRHRRPDPEDRRRTRRHRLGGRCVQVKGKPPGTFRIGTADEAAERVRYARECAGERAGQVEWHVLVQLVLETDDRWAAAGKVLERYGSMMEVDELLDTPFVLIGTVEQMAEQIVRNRERFGFTYYTVHAPFLDGFAPVVERVRQVR